MTSERFDVSDVADVGKDKGIDFEKPNIFSKFFSRRWRSMSYKRKFFSAMGLCVASCAARSAWRKARCAGVV